MFPLKDNIPTERLPVVTIALIVANVLVYFLLQGGGWTVTDTQGQWPVDQYAAIPCDIASTTSCSVPAGHIGAIGSVFTAMFMHGSLLHIGGNMLFLWIFGNNVEDAMGKVKYLLFYLAGGVAAMALHTLVDSGSSVPTIGASGAVSAVLGAYIVLYPRARVLTLIFIVLFFTVVELPAMAVLGLWFLQQLAFAALDYGSAGQGGGVAYFAHVGGFVFGLLMVRLLATRRRSTPAGYRV